MRLEVGDRVLIRMLYWNSFCSGRFMRLFCYPNFSEGGFRNRRRKLIESGFISAARYDRPIDLDVLADERVTNRLGVGGRPGTEQYFVFRLGVAGETTVREWLGDSYQPVVRELEWGWPWVDCSRLLATQLTMSVTEREQELKKWEWRTPARGFTKRRRAYERVTPSAVVSYQGRPDQIFIDLMPADLSAAGMLRLLGNYERLFSSDAVGGNGRAPLALFVVPSDAERNVFLEVAREAYPRFAFRIRTRETAVQWLHDWRMGKE